MHLLGHIERKIRAHACRWAMLPELTVESAAVDDAQTERWSREAYEDDLELDRHRYPPRTLVLIAFGALLAAGIATAADVKANPDDEDARFLHALHNAGLVLLPDGEPIVINNAHIICQEAWRGTSVDQIVSEVDAAEPNINLAQAQTVVAISMMIYCPNIGARS